MESIRLSGIDVSRWQQKVDWKRVRQSGIDFVFIKCSQGGSVSAASISPFTDSYFKSNIEGAYAAGIKCGVYHYLTGTTHEDVIAEAEYVVSILAPYKSMITFPVALDFEESRYTTFHKTYNAILIRLFTDVIKNAGYTPILYANKTFLKNYIDMSSLADLDIWHARYYTPRSCENVPTDINKMTVWQWSDRGTVDGISGNVDLDIGFFDYSSNKVETQPEAPTAETPKTEAPAQDTSLSVGDVVSIKESATVYYNGSVAIPAWVKNDYDHIITKDTYYNKKVFKGGSQCMLLGKKISRKTGKTVAGINTWIAVENIVKKQ
jgi:GH25 family lysozyme M1 (1,4-beta-N-acetylmuramidase)